MITYLLSFCFGSKSALRKYFKLKEEEVQENGLPIVPPREHSVKTESSSKCKSKYLCKGHVSGAILRHPQLTHWIVFDSLKQFF